MLLSRERFAMSAFGTPMFGQTQMQDPFSDMSHEDRQNMMNPLADHVAQQAMLFASTNHMNVDAQRTAAYWNAIAQRRAHFIQMQSQQQAGLGPMHAAAPAAQPLAGASPAPAPPVAVPPSLQSNPWLAQGAQHGSRSSGSAGMPAPAAQRISYAA